MNSKLNQTKIQLFEVTHDALDEIDPASSVPRTITEVHLGERVEKMGGRVMIVPAEHMPGRTELAAIYRY